MKGYLDPSLDADAFDEDGWFRTGDLGVIDADGNVRITGRLKDIIIRKGENISAKEVEDLLFTHDKIADVAVIGLPDPSRAEIACAVVVPADADGAGRSEGNRRLPHRQGPDDPEGARAGRVRRRVAAQPDGQSAQARTAFPVLQCSGGLRPSPVCWRRGPATTTSVCAPATSRGRGTRSCARARPRAALFDALRVDGPPHVGVLLDNVPEFLFWIGGAALAGAVVVGINPTRRGAELGQRHSPHRLPAHRHRRRPAQRRSTASTSASTPTASSTSVPPSTSNWFCESTPTRRCRMQNAS